MTDIKRRTLLGWFGGLGLVPLWRSISSLPFLAKGTEGIAEDGASQNTAIGAAVTAEALPEPGVPVEISNVQAFSDPVTRSTMLTYVTRNIGASPTTYLRLFALVFDETGGVRGGAHWLDKNRIQPGDTQTSVFQFGGSGSLYIDPKGPYARIVLAAEAGATENRTWQMGISRNDWLAAMRKGSPLETAASSSALDTSMSPNTDCCGGGYQNYQNWCETDSVAFCGEGQVQSVSASCLSCTCSFACRNSPPPPPIG